MADLAEKLSEGVTCAICHEYFKTPKVLGCLHRFCRNCIQHYINSRPGDKGIICPECRQTTRAPLSRSGEVVRRNEWADRLPTDFLIASMVENLKKEKAEGIEKCKEHKDSPLVLFCQDCDVIICHVCAGVDHRRCDRVVSLGEEAKKERERLRRKQGQIWGLRDILDRNEESMENWRRCLKTTYDKQVLSVRCDFTRIQKALKAKEDKCLKELKSAMNDEEGRLGVLDMEQITSERILDSENDLLDKVLYQFSDSKVVNRKLVLQVPDIKEVKFPGEKRPCESYEDMFEGVVKKAKIVQMKDFLDIDNS